MALPYLLLAIFPATGDAICRSRAPWMVRFKQLLAFPLYATVLWLGGCSARSSTTTRCCACGATLLLIAFALWAWHAAQRWRGTALGSRRCSRARGRRGRRVAVVVASGAGANGNAAASVAESGPWQSFTPDRLVAVDGRRPRGVRRLHRRMVRHLPGQQAAGAQHRRGPGRLREEQGHAGARRLDAPRPGASRKALAALGRNGVPVYVLVSAGRSEPLLLPEVLQQRNSLGSARLRCSRLELV